ncbi:MAG: CinA family protein [Euryarchaeota archaeon]|nr:CinA family protein [Euryarchaeota archaeon]
MSGMIRDGIHELLVGRGATVSLAESCTGGLAGYLLTMRPGASGFFVGSAVVYSNEAKERVLGVSAATLEAFGAVSPETAVEMAVGARRLFGSDYAAAVTGIAGPDGATDGKPVGMVCIAATDGRETLVRENRFGGDREAVRQASAAATLSLLAELMGL